MSFATDAIRSNTRVGRVMRFGALGLDNVDGWDSYTDFYDTLRDHCVTVHNIVAKIHAMDILLIPFGSTVFDPERLVSGEGARFVGCSINQIQDTEIRQLGDFRVEYFGNGYNRPNGVRFEEDCGIVLCFDNQVFSQILDMMDLLTYSWNTKPYNLTKIDVAFDRLTEHWDVPF